MSPEDKSPLEVSPSVGFSDTVRMSELSRGFDNPMYSEPGAIVVRIILHLVNGSFVQIVQVS